MGDPFSTHVPIETSLIVPREGGRRWYKHDTYLKIQQIYIRLYLKFYKPSLNKYIIYKLCITEIRVQLEERSYNYQKCALGGEILSKHLAPQPPIPRHHGG